MYGKFFASTFTGSMVGAGAHVFAVWGYVIANTRSDGYVELNPPILAAMIGCSPTEIEQAIEYLCSPDPKSRSQKHEGARLIQESAFLYHVPNYSDYRSIRDENDRREYMRKYMKGYRAVHRQDDVNTDVNSGKPRLAHTEAEADTEEEEEIHMSTSSTGERLEHAREAIREAVAPQVTGTLEKLGLLEYEQRTDAFLRDDLGLPIKEDPVVSIFEHWKEVMNHPKAVLDPKRRKLIAARLKERGGDLENLKQAIDGCAASPYHMGRNDTGKIHDSIQLIFRSNDDVERFMGYVTTVKRGLETFAAPPDSDIEVSCQSCFDTGEKLEFYPEGHPDRRFEGDGRYVPCPVCKGDAK